MSAGAARLLVTAEDTGAGLRVAIELELTPSGLLRARATLTNTAPGPYRVQELGLVLPLPTHAKEILDFAGHWGKERTPQRRELTVGTHLREGRKGRTGADAAYVLSVGEPGFGFADGEAGLAGQPAARGGVGGGLGEDVSQHGVAQGQRPPQQQQQIPVLPCRT